MAINKYATEAVAKDNRAIGEVHKSEIRQVVIDISIDMINNDWDAPEADEYILRINGRVLRRLNSYQAERMGIIARR